VSMYGRNTASNERIPHSTAVICPLIQSRFTAMWPCRRADNLVAAWNAPHCPTEGPLIDDPPEVLEPGRRQLGVLHRVLDIAVPQVTLLAPGTANLKPAATPAQLPQVEGSEGPDRRFTGAGRCSPSASRPRWQISKSPAAPT
jgi:hypothetical protein